MRNAMFCACGLAALALTVPAYAGEKADGPVFLTRGVTVLGTTGMLAVPSAYSQPGLSVTPYVWGTSDVFSYGGVVGLYKNRLEIGFGGIDFDDFETVGRGSNKAGRRVNGTGFNLTAKATLYEGDKTWPALAIGAVDLTEEFSDEVSWFGMLSKTWHLGKFAFDTHLGYGAGLYDDDVMGGLEIPFSNWGLRGVSALLESSAGDFNFGARYAMKGLALTVGVFDSSTVGGNVSYTYKFK